MSNTSVLRFNNKLFLVRKKEHLYCIKSARSRPIEGYKIDSSSLFRQRCQMGVGKEGSYGARCTCAVGERSHAICRSDINLLSSNHDKDL